VPGRLAQVRHRDDDGTFFLGCNNVTPVTNANGTATYTFTAATIAAGGNQVPVPTGTIKAADVLIDVQGTADLKKITLNGVKQKVAKGNHHMKNCDGDHGDRSDQGHHKHHHHQDH
jgi:hypothetical protein